MKYELAVLSRGRADVLLNRQLTLTWLQHSHYPVSLWVHKDEAEAYKPVTKAFNVRLMLHTANKVSRIRDIIMEEAYVRDVEKLGIFDDDLAFAYRNGNKLEKLHPVSIDNALRPVFGNVSQVFPMIGLRHRMFAHTETKTWGINKRIMWTPVLHLPTLSGEGFRYEWEGDILEDFHMQLQLMKAGYRTATLNLFTADDQLGADTNSGCNLYRDDDLRVKAAMLLRNKFPSCVMLRDKTNPLTGRMYKDVTIRFSQFRK